jgi:osmotically-inducible protein OsmY
LTGQVENSALVRLVESAIFKIRVVQHIHNEITVSGPTSIAVRAGDALINTKVRSKLLMTQNVNLSRFKVVTDNGVVFLMGLVPQDEASRAVEAVRTVFGVQKVVKILEYVD